MKIGNTSYNIEAIAEMSKDEFLSLHPKGQESWNMIQKALKRPVCEIKKTDAKAEKPSKKTRKANS